MGAIGRVINALAREMSDASFFYRPPPKSAGRELFNLAWLESCLAGDESAGGRAGNTFAVDRSVNCRVGISSIFRMRQNCISAVAARETGRW